MVNLKDIFAHGPTGLPLSTNGFKKQGKRSRPDGPLRSSILTREALYDRGAELGQNDRIFYSRDGGRQIYQRFEENSTVLEESYFSFAKVARDKKFLPPGAEWLLDNYHIVEEHIRDIKTHFPRGYYRSLPKLAEGDFKLFPRVYQIAFEFLSHSDAVVSTELLNSFVSGYQSRQVLSIGELWAIPIMLRLSLIENMRRLAVASLRSREKRIKAEGLFHEVFEDDSLPGTDLLLVLAGKVKGSKELDPEIAAYLIKSLRVRGRRASLALQWLEEKVRELGEQPEELIRVEQHVQAANLISIGNTVTSFKTISSFNWQRWFEGVSRVDAILRKDPVGYYGKCDFETRDDYRTQIEEIARSVGVSEAEIAEKTLTLARDAHRSAEAIPDPCGTDLRLKRSHVGYFLIHNDRQLLEKTVGFSPTLRTRCSRFLRNYVESIYVTAVLVGACGLLVAVISRAAVVAELPILLLLMLLAVIPAIGLSNDLVQWLVTHIASPIRIPKLNFSSGVPDNCRTIIAVHAIFNNTEAIRRAAEMLEVRYLGNDDPNLSFALLADLYDAEEESLPEDQNLIAYAETLIRDLNEHYFPGGIARFNLLFRPRKWNASEGKYMAWERKRGKVMEFNELLLGKNDGAFTIHAGDLEAAGPFRYVITLDGDTLLPRGIGRKLVGAIAHPLNFPEFDAEQRVVVDGYSVLQPRAAISLTSATVSNFSKIFCGPAGIDPYTQTISDVYQDLFKEGSYIGKGIYDVRAFEHALKDRVPENALLSHDLFEGLFARVALVTDIELPDDFPSSFLGYARRLHRWVRGDWQLIPWIFSKIPDSERVKHPTPFSVIDRWKLIDNLRRSLVAPTCFLLLCTAWLCLPESSPVWTVFVVLVIAFPVYANLANVLMISPVGLSFGSYAKGIGRDLLRNSQQAVLSLAFLPYQAYLMVNAIVVTLYRVWVSGRRLLEWESAYITELRLQSGASRFGSEMLPGVFLSLALGYGLIALESPSIAFAVLFVILWVLSPIIATVVSAPIRSKVYNLRDADREYLRLIGWDTWRYFDELMTEERNYLPPDNIQLAPSSTVAERTSPTNIGLAFLSIVSALDLGFVSLPSAIRRLSRTFRGLEKLERYRGHFYNWYEIKRAEALTPRYISTVDSGNLAGHLIALDSALKEFYHVPLINPLQLTHFIELIARISGHLSKSDRQLHDGLMRLREVLEGSDSSVRGVSVLLKGIDSFLVLADQNQSGLKGEAAEHELRLFIEELQSVAKISGLIHWIDAFDSMVKTIEQRLEGQATEELELLFQRLLRIEKIMRGRRITLSLIPKIHNRLLSISRYLSEVMEVNEISSTMKDVHSDLMQAIDESLGEVERSVAEIDDLRAFTQKLIQEMDFEFLYDNEKDLFTIGYSVDSASLENSYYDLLASEARLSSLVAVALGQVPQKHWFALGRSLADTSGGKALVSWSGTMFEYLMPLLVTREYSGTILSETSRAVVRAQRHYARKRKIPWGISESGYSGVDFEKTYQYRAFGIPGLGLKRGLSDDIVVSPYSTFLALPVDPGESLKNMRVLEKMGMRGQYGFYEAIDFTPERLSREERFHIVESFLVHHQGMSLVAIANFLLDGLFQDRFHRNAAIKSAELLLHEKFPSRIPAIVPHQAEMSFLEREEEGFKPLKGEVLYTPHTVIPRTRVLSNQQYSIMVDNVGSGYSVFQDDIALTRWREDIVHNHFGSYIFVRDTDSGDVWSTTYQPTCVEPGSYEVVFNPDKVEFKRRDHGIGLHTEVTISPEDNVEVRRVTVTNFSARKRVVELTSYGEIALASRSADAAHPAFSKMFVESDYMYDVDALLFSRRPRSRHDRELHLFHSIAMKICWSQTQYDTSRTSFLGRGRTVHNPVAIESGYPLRGTVGPVLDPVMSLRTRIEIEPGSSQSVNFITGVAESRPAIEDLARRYHELHAVRRAFEMSWSKSNVELRHEQFSIAQSHAFQHLGNALLFNINSLRGDEESIKQNRLSQAGLWRFGVSGDLPLLLLKIGDPQHKKLLREVLLAHEYLRLRGIRFDIVVLNEYPGGYFEDFHEEIDSLIRQSFSAGLSEQNRGVFLRPQRSLSSEDIALLSAVARVVLVGSRGPLANQVEFDHTLAPHVPVRGDLVSLLDSGQEEYQPATSALEFFNGSGGFANNGKSYSIIVKDDARPPLPWSNVVANPHFGFLVTESGGGYTWSENSRENRITPWSNDPVSDPHGEAIFIRDTEGGAYWCPTPGPVRTGEVYNTKHHMGRSEFETQIRRVFSRVTISGSQSEKVKWWKLDLVNGDYKPRQLEVFLYVDWTLGIHRDQSSRYIHTMFDSETQTLRAVNHYNNEFAGRTAFIGSSEKIKEYTADRIEFLGRNSSLAAPYVLEKMIPTSLASLVGRKQEEVLLSKRTGAGLDACGAIKVNVVLDPLESRELLFYLSEQNSDEVIKERASSFRSFSSYNNELSEVDSFWESTTDTLQVRTPERSFDVMLNGWLLYQMLSCRINGRSAFYQSGGAFGYRDQLQDSLCFLHVDPAICRDQILLHASRQFLEGDVQHWWHPPTGRGVRTRISDDYLWLPFVVLKYLEATGDRTILHEQVPFLEGDHLEGHQAEAYIIPRESAHKGSIYEHCIIALDRALTTGQHGLPLMGGGDWNDGMNEVGIEGKGESVWLGWFIGLILEGFIPLIQERNDNYRAGIFKEHRHKLLHSIEEHGWDGQWYRRAFFDNGDPLGSHLNDECQIDSLSQSWAVISGAANPDRVESAMSMVYKRLVREREGIICLLDPPFDKGSLEPGYIKGYLPGIRENGGQYTHAAAWVIMATAMRGDGEQAMKLFQLINPVNHTDTRLGVSRYQGEPYVTCGDVYSMPPFQGRAGWSWYTGSAGWLYQAGLNNILGFKLSDNYFEVNPCVPSSWDSFSFQYRRGQCEYQVQVNNPDGVQTGVVRVMVDGLEMSDGRIEFISDPSDLRTLVHVEVVMG